MIFGLGCLVGFLFTLFIIKRETIETATQLITWATFVIVCGTSAFLLFKQ